MDQKELAATLEAILANQQSLHDDLVLLYDRLDKIEQAFQDLPNHLQSSFFSDDNELYLAARSYVVETSSASVSRIQRIFRIGYSQASAILDKLEANGVIGPYVAGEPRQVLLTKERLEEIEYVEEEKFLPSYQLLNINSAQDSDTDDELYQAARDVAIEAGKCSVSLLQRKLKIGYSRSARLIDLLESHGVIGKKLD